METPTKPLDAFWDRSLLELFQLLQATPNGLTSEEANQRLRLYGPNSLDQESRFAALFSFFGLFANPLVIILVVASVISLALGRHAVEEIQKQIATTAIVMRNGRFIDLPIADLVPGDVIQLKAGDLVPADARLLDVKDLHVTVAVVLPYTALGRLLRFTALPISLLVMIALLTGAYLFLVQVVKTWFYRKHALL